MPRPDACNSLCWTDLGSETGGFETGGPGRSRTADLRFRKPSLYPSELRGRVSSLNASTSVNGFHFPVADEAALNSAR
jgi:hypothetical protein